MAVIDAILPKPKVIVLLGSSVSDITAQFLFGSVYNIYETSDRFAIGDNVMFDNKKGTVIGDDTGSNYYLLDESDLFFTEVEAPLPP